MENTKYGFWKIIDYTFDEAIEKVTEALKKEGFGVLADLDIKATLKAKLDVNFKPYRILAACNPPSAYKALQAEDQIGLLLPCNVIVYENDNNEIVVASIDPVASMFSVDSKPVQEVAASVKETLMKVINSL